MIETSLAHIANVTGGAVLHADSLSTVTGSVSIDSRAVEPGSLFAAIAGERVDGHDFAAEAVAGGAAAVLAERELPGVPCVVVNSTVAALAALATDLVTRCSTLRVVGVTGSSGKTSTKDLLAQVLAALGPVVAPVGSFNNELGLPLTVLRVVDDTATLVAEMGARGPGHVAELCAIAQPTIGVVLNVGSAHLGEFGSRSTIAAAKGELVQSLPPTGVAVLNADDPLVAAMAADTVARVITFGESPSADVRAIDVSLDDQARASFRLVLPDSAEPPVTVTLRLHGEHQVSNALATAAVAHSLGMSAASIAAALSEAGPVSRWRMEVSRRPDGVTIINDAYNANPESMRAALKALVGMAGSGRSWAVLGEMRELGDDSAVEHDALGRLAVRLDVSRLVAVGEGAKAMHLGAAHEGSWGQESVWLPDLDSAATLLATELEPGDVVLIKASRSLGFETLATALLTGQPTDQRTSQPPAQPATPTQEAAL